MFREGKARAPTHAARCKLRCAGAKARVLQRQGGPASSRGGRGEVHRLPLLPAPSASTKLPLCQGIMDSSLGPDAPRKSYTEATTRTPTGICVTLCIARAE